MSRIEVDLPQELLERLETLSRRERRSLRHIICRRLALTFGEAADARRKVGDEALVALAVAKFGSDWREEFRVLKSRRDRIGRERQILRRPPPPQPLRPQ